MALRGKIDRVERHEDGRLAILDYKTGDKAADPEKWHRTRGEWVNLQLPLYRHLAEELGADDRAVLGYLPIPRANEAVKEQEASWTPADLQRADEAARAVVRAVREDRFDEVGEGADGGVFQALCGKELLGAEQGEDE
jgi:ATP-dependent helicase/nuclease subunit B